MNKPVTMNGLALARVGTFLFSLAAMVGSM